MTSYFDVIWRPDVTPWPGSRIMPRAQSGAQGAKWCTTPPHTDEVVHKVAWAGPHTHTHTDGSNSMTLTADAGGNYNSQMLLLLKAQEIPDFVQASVRDLSLPLHMSRSRPVGSIHSFKNFCNTHCIVSSIYFIKQRPLCICPPPGVHEQPLPWTNPQKEENLIYFNPVFNPF